MRTTYSRGNSCRVRINSHFKLSVAKLCAKTPNKAKDDYKVTRRTTVKPVRRHRQKKNRSPSDFIWPFLWPYMGVIPNPKMAFIFPISCILALIFQFLIKNFPNVKEKVAS